jgi:hypothetical protein
MPNLMTRARLTLMDKAKRMKLIMGVQNTYLETIIYHHLLWLIEKLLQLIHGVRCEIQLCDLLLFPPNHGMCLLHNKNCTHTRWVQYIIEPPHCIFQFCSSCPLRTSKILLTKSSSKNPKLFFSTKGYLFTKP